MLEQLRKQPLCADYLEAIGIPLVLKLYVCVCMAHPFLFLHAHARGHPEGGCNGGKHGDDNVENLSPYTFTFHSLVDSFLVDN